MQRFARSVSAYGAFAGVLAAPTAAFAPPPAALAPPPIPVVDLHVDLAYQYNYVGKAFPDGGGQCSRPALERGGVSAVVLPLFVPRMASASGPRLVDLERSYRRVNRAILDTPPFAAPGCVAGNGRVRTFYAFEGAGPLANDPEALVRWQARGLRIVGLVHRTANELASSSGDATPVAYGLSERGRVFVRRAFELALVVDVSHASDAAVTDVIALAEVFHGVVVATHSNARRIADHPRNVTDEQARAIARTGGVIGVNFHGPFLARGRAATLADVVRHIRHLTDVAGRKHVAIGSDFEGDINPPAELADASRYPRLRVALASAGFEDATIADIFSGNALRVLCPGAGSKLDVHEASPTPPEEPAGRAPPP